MDLINATALRALIQKEIPDVNNNVLTRKEARSLIKQYASQGYFNIGEAANYCGISRSTFDKWRKEGRIAPHIINGIVRFARSDLDRMMQHDE